MKEYRPLNDRILVKRKDAEKTTTGGLHIPDSRQIKNRFAEVLAVGPGRWKKDTAERLPMGVQPGQVVFFRGTAGEEVDLDGETYVMLREYEVDGIVDEP